VDGVLLTLEVLTSAELTLALEDAKRAAACALARRIHDPHIIFGNFGNFLVINKVYTGNHKVYKGKFNNLKTRIQLYVVIYLIIS